MLQCVKQHSLDLSRLVCVTTDGVPAMTGEKKDAALLLVHHCEAAGHTQSIHKVHCILDQEFLCSMSANLTDLLSIAVKVVNFILSSSLTHSQFSVMTDEVNAHYGNLLYFWDVRWLSQEAMLFRVCDLQQEIALSLIKRTSHVLITFPAHNGLFAWFCSQAPLRT